VRGNSQHLRFPQSRLATGCYKAAKWLQGDIGRFGGSKFEFFTEEEDHLIVKQVMTL